MYNTSRTEHHQDHQEGQQLYQQVFQPFMVSTFMGLAPLISIPVQSSVGHREMKGEGEMSRKGGVWIKPGAEFTSELAWFVNERRKLQTNIKYATLTPDLWRQGGALHAPPHTEVLLAVESYWGREDLLWGWFLIEAFPGLWMALQPCAYEQH